MEHSLITAESLDLLKIKSDNKIDIYKKRHQLLDAFLKYCCKPYACSVGTTDT